MKIAEDIRSLGFPNLQSKASLLEQPRDSALKFEVHWDKYRLIKTLAVFCWKWYRYEDEISEHYQVLRKLDFKDPNLTGVCLLICFWTGGCCPLAITAWCFFRGNPVRGTTCFPAVAWRCQSRWFANQQVLYAFNDALDTSEPIASLPLLHCEVPFEKWVTWQHGWGGLENLELFFL